MSKSFANMLAREVYSMAMRHARYEYSYCGAIAVYHDGLVYVWHVNGFDGVWIIEPRKSWI